MHAEVKNAPHVKFFGVPCGCGARDKRCAYGPESIATSDIQRRLQNLGYLSHWQMLENEDSEGIDASQTISTICATLAAEIKKPVLEQDPFVVVGGDHSCTIGSWSGVASARSPLGLIWVDAHLDSHTPDTSPSQAIHGMPLASLLGFGDESLTKLPGPFPKIKPEHVHIIGARSYEPEEIQLLAKLDVRVSFIEEVHHRGIKSIFDEALERVTRNTQGFGISIDLDAIDPIDAPGVGSPETGGLAAEELITALSGIASKEKFLGLEIAELNPVIDINKKTSDLTCRLIESIFKGASE